MTRRQAAITALMAIAGAMTGKGILRAQEKPNSTLLGSGTNVTTGLFSKPSISFPLDSFTEYTFRLGDETITMTPAEVMAALKS